jgi:hypothetical protein
MLLYIAVHRHQGCQRHSGFRHLSPVPDWVPLFRYRTGSRICIRFQSGTGQTGCLTVRHLQKLYWVRWKGVKHPARGEKTPCTCTSIMLVVETPCTSTRLMVDKKSTLHVHIWLVWWWRLPLRCWQITSKLRKRHFGRWSAAFSPTSAFRQPVPLVTDKSGITKIFNYDYK